MNIIPARNGHASMPASYMRITPHVSHKSKTWDYRRGYNEFMIEGSANSAMVDSSNRALNQLGMEFDGLPLPLIDAHFGRQVGEVVWLRQTAAAIFVRGAIFPHETLLRLDIDTQRLCRFSIGADPLEPTVLRDDGAVFFPRWKLREVSIVEQGGNPGAMFWRWSPDDEVVR